MASVTFNDDKLFEKLFCIGGKEYTFGEAVLLGFDNTDNSTLSTWDLAFGQQSPCFFLYKIKTTLNANVLTNE
jgi:hypothetical protein